MQVQRASGQRQACLAEGLALGGVAVDEGGDVVRQRLPRGGQLRLADELATLAPPVGGAVRAQIDALLRGEKAVMTESIALVLTPRELEVLEHLAAGLSRREIAEKLFVSENTIKTQVSSLYRKLEATTRAELLAQAHTRGLI